MSAACTTCQKVLSCRSSLRRHKKHDKQKNEYCEDEGVPILRIPHYDFDKSEVLIKQFLETYTTWSL